MYAYNRKNAVGNYTRESHVLVKRFDNLLKLMSNHRQIQQLGMGTSRVRDVQQHNDYQFHTESPEAVRLLSFTPINI